MFTAFIPFSVILDELDFKYTNHLRGDDTPRFKWVSLLTHSNPTPSNTYLQICTLSEALTFSKQKSGFYYLCLRDRIADNLETEETLQNMIIINENMELRELFNHVQKIFIKIKNWIMELQQAVIQRKDIQYLLDLSEPIMNNYIHVLDPTFKFLAYTKNKIFPDENFHEVMKSGYLPEDSIKKIQEAGIIGMYRKTDDIIVNKKRNVCDYITIERCYKQNGDYTISVVMVFCHRDYTDGQAELFKILTDYIKLLVEQQYFEKLNFFPAESLITDLLNNTTDNIHIIKQRASYVNIPFESTFQLLLISFSDYTNIPERQVISKFSDLLFPAKVIPYQHQIVILTSYNDEILPSSKNDKNILKIQPLVNEYDAFCGISNSFSFLYEIPVAYKQAKIVVPLGKKIENNHGIFCSGRNMDRIYKFEDYYIHIILDTCLKENTDLLSKSFSVDTLKALQEHDSVHNTEYFKILYHFLTNERRASDASKGLNMHRNTVVYHIEKISELFHLNLDNSDDRLKLLLGYKILEINSTPYFSPPFLNTTETQTGNFM